MSFWRRWRNYAQSYTYINSRAGDVWFSAFRALPIYKINCKSIEKNRNISTKVEIIRYFCIVKRLDHIFRKACLLLFVFLTAPSWAGEHDDGQAQPDMMEVSLLTCSPGDEVWSLYGHTAIRLYDRANGSDLVANYGMFSFSQPFFVARFVFGRTDYQMGIQSYEDFIRQYAFVGRGVKEQRLLLTREEKMAIVKAIAENYEPQNREYRYNFFYDNCTTRARDMLVVHIDGTVDYQARDTFSTTYRKEIHNYNTTHRWARFGNDLLLGVKADAQLTNAQRQFLPENLERDFARATVKDDNGETRKLVAETREVLQPETDTGGQDLWDYITPGRLFATLFLVVAASTFFEYRRGKMFWPIDMVLFTLCGLAGLILTAMIFSAHPTVSLNLQIFLLNPLFLYALRPKVFLKTDKGAASFRYVALASIGIALISQFFQTFAEGMTDLALILLIRIIANLRSPKSIAETQHDKQ